MPDVPEADSRKTEGVRRLRAAAVCCLPGLRQDYVCTGSLRTVRAQPDDPLPERRCQALQFFENQKCTACGKLIK
jgi:hypothetical protein